MLVRMHRIHMCVRSISRCPPPGPRIKPDLAGSTSMNEGPHP